VQSKELSPSVGTHFRLLTSDDAQLIARTTRAPKIKFKVEYRGLLNRMLRSVLFILQLRSFLECLSCEGRIFFSPCQQRVKHFKTVDPHLKD
jgi:hypothetical protein